MIGSALALLPVRAFSQTGSYPTRAIRLIIPSTPGGGSDLVGRTLANEIAKLDSKWTLVPENRAGVAGTVGLTEVAKSAPDGYGIGVALSEAYSIAAQIMKVPFDAIRDFTPIALVATTPSMFVVPSNSPFQTLGDLVAAAKERPGEITYGTSGAGSAAHLAGELLQKDAGIRLTHVPYKGSTPAVADLLGGHITLACTSIATALPHLQAGRMRGLGVTGPGRDPSLPDVPAVGELGFPNVIVVTWFGILGPAKMPEEIVAQLNGVINEVLSVPAVKTTLATSGLLPRTMTPSEFGDMIHADFERMKVFIRDTGLATG